MSAAPVAVSVIVCTHNPRADYLRRVLEALERQTLPPARWELIVVDNASDVRLSEHLDLSWHPHGIHRREDKLGLTEARLHGIRAARAKLLVFVDDDNVVADDFLAAALHIAEARPEIGAWGGSIHADFDVTPPDWTKRYWSWLGIRDIDRDKWTNQYDWGVVPCGAGLCVRREVAAAYERSVIDVPLRGRLDRKGSQLTGSGDLDLAFTACDQGLGIGLFTSLRVTHLIPAFRLELSYFVRLAEGNGYSAVLFSALRQPMAPVSRARRVGAYVRALMLPRVERKLRLAYLRGERRALESASPAADGGMA